MLIYGTRQVVYDKNNHERSLKSNIFSFCYSEGIKKTFALRKVNVTIILQL